MQTYDRKPECYACRVGSGSGADGRGRSGAASTKPGPASPAGADGDKDPASNAPVRAPSSRAVRSRRCATSRVAAGVSQSTVSRVLNDAPTRVPIAAETRERVILAARRLGYRPNPLARGLRGASTMLIGAVVRDFSDPFFAGAIEALAVEAMARGYNVVLGHAHGRLDEGIALTTVLETRHTDAIVMLGDMQDQPRLLDDLRESVGPGRRPVAGDEPPRVPDRRRRRASRHPRRARAPRRASATSGSRSSAAGSGRQLRSARTPSSSS